MKQLIFQDGILHAAINKKIRLIAMAEAFCNSLGLIILMLRAFLLHEEDEFNTTIYFIFTLLMILELNMYIFTKFWQEKLCRLQTNKEIKESSSYNVIIVESMSWIQMFQELIHISTIFFQPCMIYPEWLNKNLLILTLVRIYLVVEFFFGINLIRNHRLQRITNTLGVQPKILCWKIGYRQYFAYRMIGIVIIVILGLGNILKDYQSDNLEDIIEATYFIFVTMSTVGYGDILIIRPFSRFVTVIILFLGIFMSSLLTSKILNESGVNQQQKGIYYLVKKLAYNQRRDELLTKLLFHLLDQAEQKNNSIQIFQPFNDDLVVNQQKTIPPSLRQKEKQILEDQLSQAIEQNAKLEQINPVRMVTLIYKASRLKHKLDAINSLNDYFAHLPLHFYKENRRRKVLQNQL